MSVQPTQCVDWELKVPAGHQLSTAQQQTNRKRKARVRRHLQPGIPSVKTFRCDVKQPWTPSHVVPDCETEKTQQAAYNVVTKVLYRAASPPVPATCLSQYAALVRPFYQALDWTFSARCFSISVDMNVTFVELQTEMHLV